MKHYAAICNGVIYGFSRNRLTAYLEAEEAVGSQYLNQFPIELREVTETQYELICDGVREWNGIESRHARNTENVETETSEGA